MLQIKRLKRDLKSQGNDLNKLKSKEADAEDVATELENMKRKLALIESNFKSKSKEIKSLKAKLANLTRYQREKMMLLLSKQKLKP